MLGSVAEYGLRMPSGRDRSAQPTVSYTCRLVDVRTGQVVWATSASAVNYAYLLAVSRGENISEKLEQMAMENERVELHQLQISDYQDLPRIFDDFMNVIEEYGMNPFKGM